MQQKEPLPLLVEKCLGFALQPQAENPQKHYRVSLFKEAPQRNHFTPRPTSDGIKFLILHYTQETLLESLEIMTRDIPQGRVSAHYLISEKESTPPIAGGNLIQLVPEDQTAWHAGHSYWQRNKNLNETSIGIELVNSGQHLFDPNQIETLGRLTRDIVNRYAIHPTRVVGHSDIAPGRKADPGPLFPWGTLHERFGVGAWLDPKEQTPEAIYQTYQPLKKLPHTMDLTFLKWHLETLGYDVSDDDTFQGAIKAFQAHFSKNQMPHAISGKPDWQDMFWSWALVWKYTNPKV